MNESLVQWTLLNNLDFLSKSLDFQIANKIGQEITTDFGRVDFIVEDFEQKKLELVNGLFGVNYRKRTMYEILNFTCNFCIELGLIERIASSTKYDKLYFTPLGIEVNNIFSLDLSQKKSRLNLNFKYLK